jgi:hypothetical protein
MPIIGFIMPIIGFIIGMPIIGFMPIPLLIGFIIGFIGIIPMFELVIGCGIAFIMLPASYASSSRGQAIGRYARSFPLFARRSVSPLGNLSVAAD